MKTFGSPDYYPIIPEDEPLTKRKIIEALIEHEKEQQEQCMARGTTSSTCVYRKDHLACYVGALLSEKEIQNTLSCNGKPFIGSVLDLRDNGYLPERLEPFTRHEYEDGYSFLVIVQCIHDYTKDSEDRLKALRDLL